MMILQLKLVEDNYTAYNRTIDSGLMFCLIMNEKIEIISIDSRSNERPQDS